MPFNFCCGLVNKKKQIHLTPSLFLLENLLQYKKYDIIHRWERFEKRKKIFQNIVYIDIEFESGNF